MDTKIEFTKIKNDTYGNPRYVVHFLNIADNYQDAIHLANKIGGRKYHTKSYGGGIVFQSYNIKQTERKITELIRQQTDNINE
jgi:hypothetical protein